MINRQSKKCDHTETVTSLVAGIKRVVCESCGAVEIEYDHDSVLASAMAEFDPEPVG